METRDKAGPARGWRVIGAVLAVELIKRGISGAPFPLP